MKKPALPASDAWLLCSIGLVCWKGRSARLEDILEASDAVNHAILTHGELDGGLARLIRAGHVVATATGFAPSRRTARPLRALLGVRRRLLDHVENVRKFLGAAPWVPGETPPAWGTGRTVRRADFRAALKTCLAR